MRDIPYGYCHCRCGQKTKVSTITSSEKGWVKGEPHRYVNGHNGRGKSKPNRYIEQDRGYETPCWVWQLALHSRHGYGHTWNGERVVHAHRFYWEQRYGPVPDGLELDHLCRVRACVNPDHLEAVTHTENCRRGAKAILTVEQVEVVRERLARGHFHKDIAADLGVGKSAITEISVGRSWR